MVLKLLDGSAVLYVDAPLVDYVYQYSRRHDIRAERSANLLRRVNIMLLCCNVVDRRSALRIARLGFSSLKDMESF